MYTKIVNCTPHVPHFCLTCGVEISKKEARTTGECSDCFGEWLEERDREWEARVSDQDNW